MNKKGVTILELLISISMLSVIILLLIKVMFSLENINNDKTYASSDEISRTEIIKNIESDFLNLKLNGLSILENTNETKITFNFVNDTKELIIKTKELVYDNNIYSLKSDNASYKKCVEYKYLSLENNYYYITLTIPILIDGINTTENDDITLTYIGLKKDNSNYPEIFSCLNNSN